MFFSRKVDVTFVDGGTGEVIARTRLPPDQLPETFLVETTLHLHDEPWAVLKAEPPTRAEFARTRRLVLTVARVRVETMDPRDLLFSLPSLNDALPELAGEADGSEPEMVEDDWRQLEFVSATLRFVVEDELGEVQRIYDEHRVGAGFDSVHVRERIADPLEGVTLGDVRALGLAPAQPLRMRGDGHGMRIRGGFAHVLPGGWVLYGIAVADEVTALGLDPAGDSPPAEVIAVLERLAADHGLLLVDWCRCGLGEPGDESFAAIFA